MERLQRRLCPYAPHPQLERRYLVVPGLRSSRIHIIDTKPDPQKLEIVKTIEPEELFARTGYSRPHTVHCGPEGIYVSALGAPDGGGPGGIFILDHLDFNVLGRWEVDRGPQELAYDFWWHLGHDTLISSEWGTPNKIENGLDPETLLSSGYGHQMHIWDLRRAKASTSDRPRQGTADGPGTASFARSDSDFWICRRSRFTEGSLGFDLAVETR